MHIKKSFLGTYLFLSHLFGESFIDSQAEFEHSPDCSALVVNEMVNPEKFKTLKGLYFSNSSKINVCYFEGVRIEADLPDQSAFHREMEEFLGRDISEDLILEIKQKAVAFFQSRNFPIIGVLAPKQKLSCRTLSFVILIGKLGSVKSVGANYFSNQTIGSWIRTKPGESIRSDQMHSDLNWINQNPFYTTTLIYQPGQQLGETDIVLQTQDRYPVKIYTGYENTGTVTVGTTRFLAGLSWGNVFNLGHQLNYLFIFDTPVREWWAQVANYIAPLPWRHIFKAYGSYTRVNTNMLPPFQSKGQGWVLGGRYTIPFFLSQLKNELFFGYEFKRTNNFLSFNVQTVFNKYVDVSQFILGYTGRIEYNAGISSIGANLFISPGNMTEFNRTSIYNLERPGANCRYAYGQIQFDQVLRLPRNCSWVLNSSYQLSSAKLLPSEEFAIGGFYTVRGYDEYELIGDDGMLLKNELRSSPIKLPAPRNKIHELQFLGFIDMGYAIEIDPAVLANSTSFLASIGPGIRYNFGEYISARLDFGVQLHHIHRLQENTPYHGRIHFGCTAAY